MAAPAVVPTVGMTLLPATVSGGATLVALLLATAILVYLYATRHFAYWRRRGVPYLKPLPFIGNMLDIVLFRKHFGELLCDVHRKAKNHPYFGMFMFDQPVLLIKDIDVWKRIVQKDFSHFFDRGFTPGRSDSIWMSNVFASKGQKWRTLRMNLRPGFSKAKLKRLYTLIEDRAQYLDTFFDEGAKAGMPQEVADACGRYSTDVVAAVGFGIDSKSLLNDKCYFRKVLKNAFTYSKFGHIISMGWFARVPITYYPGSKLTPEDLRQYLRLSIWETVKQRQDTGTVGVRGDFLDHLIEIKEKGSVVVANEEDELNGIMNDIPKTKLTLEGDAFISQAWTFLAAGFDTSSNTMSFALYELAKNQDIQDDLRATIQSALKASGGKFTYESFESINYLEMVALETLRLYPSIPFLDRTCTEMYRMPNSDLVIEKDTVLMCSLLGIHMDPMLYPNPERFDPSRFSEDEIRNRPACSYMPFGDGPRLCLGMRLGLLQVKVGLAHILLNYSIQPCDKTPPYMAYNPRSFLLISKDGIPLKFTRIKH